MALYVRPTEIKYHFKLDNYALACVVLPVNGFGSDNLILICSWLLLFANGAYTGVIASIAVIYTGIEQNPMDSPACYSVNIAFYY